MDPGARSQGQKLLGLKFQTQEVRLLTVNQCACGANWGGIVFWSKGARSREPPGQLGRSGDLGPWRPGELGEMGGLRRHGGLIDLLYQEDLEGGGAQ